MEKDDTQYRLITSDYVSVGDFEGHPMLKVEPEGLRLLAAEAFHDVAFFLRPAHLKQVAAILDDPEASDNDKSVALTMLRNAEVASAGILPFCQDTGTATIVGKKGQQVWTGCDDCEQLSHGVYDAYTQNNLRYSQTVALDMYTEKNTGTNLPAQIDLEAVEGMKYSFLFVAKGGGSANKTYLYQETKALLNPATLKKFLVEKMSTLGTAACPPYHIAPEWQGRGAGTFTLAKLLDECRNRHMRKACGIIFADNRGSIALMKHFGFTQFGLMPQAATDSTGTMRDMSYWHLDL